jgi:indolepyruvate ferredoxin oxidoreductase alpha subunit
VRRAFVEQRMADLAKFSDETPLNKIEWHDKKIGVIVSGVAYYYAKEVFGDSVSYLKIGFSWPLPSGKIKEFCSQVGEVYVIEENDPLVESAVKALGFTPKAKDVLPHWGELLPEVIRKCYKGEVIPQIDYDKSKVVPRPPALCAGCPHRGFFVELAKQKDVIMTSDIGCYAMGADAPYNAEDFNMCMGSAFSVSHGAQQIFNTIPGNNKRVVAYLGDSTFFHTGMNSLLEAVYNGSNTICVIMDNAITGMTGHQNNPGNGLNARDEIANRVAIEDVCKAFGVKNIRIIDPNKLQEVKDALEWAKPLNEVSVIITRWPCALKRITAAEKSEYHNPFTGKCKIDADKCIGCKMCIKSGCPAISFDAGAKKALIDAAQCLGCGVCSQMCNQGAIEEAK